jgi:hypothetical protein
MRVPRIALVLIAAFACTLAVVRPHVAERWGLYLGSPADRAHAVLFLDPFPNDATCETRAEVFAENAERAFCTGRHVLQFGDGDDALLAADFNPLWPASWVCRPHDTPRTSLRRRWGGGKFNSST